MQNGAVEKAVLCINLEKEPDKDSTKVNPEIFEKELKAKIRDALGLKSTTNISRMDKTFNFIVQYNPKTLNSSSSDGKIRWKRSKSGNKIKQSKTEVHGNSTLTFELIFDDCHGVRKRMDAIMSVLSTSYTNHVSFCWSQMLFEGILTNVENKFTMFDAHGNPISGTMHLTLTQEKKDKWPGYCEGNYWNNAFKKCFKKL